MEGYHALIRRHSRPLAPIPTGERPVLGKRENIRAVLWDVYGTLLISGSGEVGTAAETVSAEAFHAATQTVGIALQCSGEDGVACLKDTIRTRHERARERGVEYPEVDMVEIFRQTWASLVERRLALPHNRTLDFERLAVEYEVRSNPVWPMPGVVECLERLRHGGMLLGLVSNAQFFTCQLFPALLDRSVEELGFDAELQFYSYRVGHAKPGERLFRLAQQALAQRSITAGQAIYVGNDMLNDVLPAARVGFRTALFAGDARSLRRRNGDPRVAGIVPDIVLTDLMQLVSCVN